MKMQEFTDYFDVFSASPTSVKANKTVSAMPKDLSLAMAYIPFQNLGVIYDDDKALKTGTLFEELDKPFSGKGYLK